LFTIVEHTYGYLDANKPENERNFIVWIKYTSKVPGLKIKPVMMKNPSCKKNSKPTCMAFFFDKSEDITHELIIDTRTTIACDFVRYINYPGGSTITVDDLIERQHKHWRFSQELLLYGISSSIKEGSNGKYIMSLKHGSGIIILEISSDDRVVTFKIVNTNSCCNCAVTSIKEHEISKTVQDIQVYCDT